MIQMLTQELHAAMDKKELQKMKEEYATLRTQMTSLSNQMVALINTKHEEAKTLAEAGFEHALTLTQAMTDQLAQQNENEGQAQPAAQQS